MSVSWKIASMGLLPLSLALVGTGCMAPADEQATDETVTGEQAADQQTQATDKEQTGDAKEACGGFWGGGCGGFPFWGGGFGGCGGCGGWGGGWGGCGGGCGGGFWGGGGCGGGCF